MSIKNSKTEGLEVRPVAPVDPENHHSPTCEPARRTAAVQTTGHSVWNRSVRHTSVWTPTPPLPGGCWGSRELSASPSAEHGQWSRAPNSDIIKAKTARTPTEALTLFIVRNLSCRGYELSCGPLNFVCWSPTPSVSPRHNVTRCVETRPETRWWS